MSKKTKKDWTIMVYMAGDNNLSEDMVTGLMGMKKCLEATFNANVAFLAYYDTGALSFPTVKCDFTKKSGENSSKDFFVQDSGQPVIQSNQNEETSENSIYQFVEWCIKTREHEAENYALIFSGHGDGFQEASFLRDEHPFSFITVPGLRRTLQEISKKLLDQKKLSILGFDSCVMSTIEVAYEMSDVADIMVSSQGFVPNAGWDYGKIVENLSKQVNKNIELSKEVVAKVIARSFIQKYRDYAFFNGRSVDVGLCDLTKVEAVAESVYELGNQLEEALKNGSELLARKIEQAVLASHFKSQTFIFEQCVDTRDFCENLQKECAVIEEENEQILKLLDSPNKKLKDINNSVSKISDACEKTIRNLEKCIMQCTYLGAEFQYATGLSLYFPWSYISFILAKPQYLTRDFAVGKEKDDKKKSNNLSDWTSFLECYLLKTLREIRQSSAKDYYLFQLNAGNVVKSETDIFKLNTPFDRLNTSFGDRLNTSFGDRLNTSFGDRLNTSFGDRLNTSFGDRLMSSILNNFGRTKNLPWAPKLWEPSDSIFDDED